LTIYSIVLVLVTLACLALSLWYARKLGDMLSGIAKHAQKIHIVTGRVDNRVDGPC